GAGRMGLAWAIDAGLSNAGRGRKALPWGRDWSAWHLASAPGRLSGIARNRMRGKAPYLRGGFAGPLLQRVEKGAGMLRRKQHQRAVAQRQRQHAAVVGDQAERLAAVAHAEVAGAEAGQGVAVGLDRWLQFAVFGQ